MHKTIPFFLFFTLALTCISANIGNTAPLQASSPTELNSATIKTLIAVGDLNFAGELGTKILANPEYPWQDTLPVLSQANILVGNLEVPLSKRGSIYTPKTWTLRANPDTVKALTAGGFDVVTLANNHILDYGLLALQDTLDTLKAAGIGYTGAGANLADARKPVFLTTPEGLKFAFLAYSLTFPEQFWAGSNRPGTAYGDPSIFLADIKKAKLQADLVVVSFHWSNELKYYPSDYQKNYGRRCIDAGAALVLGHHPHVLQGIEVYRGGLIAYSLGNFAFGSWSNKVKDSIILAVDYDSAGLLTARLYPVNVNNYEVKFQTKLRKGQDAERVLQDMRTYSAEFNTTILSQGNTGVIKIR